MHDLLTFEKFQLLHNKNLCDFVTKKASILTISGVRIINIISNICMTSHFPDDFSNNNRVAFPGAVLVQTG